VGFNLILLRSEFINTKEIMEVGDWKVKLSDIPKKEYFRNLINFLNLQAREKKTIYPPRGQWFKAFELTHFKDVKVVILGQDPYHNPGQAQGMSFSVPEGVSLPPSLRNIFQEIQSDLGVNNQSGDLTSWAKQGVLLLNSVLTVEKNQPASHAGKGWEEFTDYVIKLINKEKENVVFMLWGAYAQKKASNIDSNRHLILESPHPSPFSAHKGFFGCQHFSKTNNYLKINNINPINWKL
jgi:uracil-DNA glycosylase